MALPRLGMFQFQCPAVDVTPLSLPASLTTVRGLRELDMSLTGWHPALKGFTSTLTQLMVRFVSWEQKHSNVNTLLTSLLELWLQLSFWYCA